MWIKDSSDTFYNLNAARTLSVGGTGSSWYIYLTTSDVTSHNVRGPYTTQAEGVQAIKDLLSGS